MKTNYLLLCCTLLCLLSSCGTQEPEEPLVLKESEIMNDFHQDHLGQITFMEGYISYDEYTEDDFAEEVVLNDKTNLGIRVFLEKTVAWYLHELEPALSVEELCEKGNLQFSFFVDNALVYTENLNVGAGGPYFKTQSQVFYKPLASTENEDSWGRFLWMRFMQRGGGMEALDGGDHELKIELRTYIETDELKVGEKIAEGSVLLLAGEEKPVSEEEIAVQKIEPVEDWTISEAKIDEEKIRSLNKRIAQNRFKELSGIAVIKEGELLLEEYFNGSTRETLHNTRSVGKSFASTVAGIAIAEGHLKLDQTLGDFYDLKKYDNYSPEKEKVSVKSLLQMASGIEGSDMNSESPGNEENMYPTDDWVKFTLDLPMEEGRAIGEQWDYFTAGVVVLGDILDKSVPGGLEKYAEEKLFAPLGITNYQWQYTPQEVANTAGGLQMNVLDYAKYGQLYKNGGEWNGQQIISKAWVEESLSPMLTLPQDMGGAYGYLFWNKKFKVGEKTYEASFASGNGGNKILIFKDIPVVIVFVAQAYGKPYGHSQAMKIVEQYLLPAVL